MTSKFSIDDKELLQRISSGEAVVGLDFGNLIVRELAAFRLAAMDSEPVAADLIQLNMRILSAENALEKETKYTRELEMQQSYRHAQPAPVVTFYRDGIEAAAKWIDQQREAYDSEHEWSDPDTGAFEFGNDAQREYSSTLEELAEGIRALHPNAGMQPAPVEPDSREQFEAWAKKQGLMSESFGIRSVNEQFVNSCWEAWQESRAAMLQAGNSPVIPDGYVMVPKKPTERMVIDGFESEPDETFSEPEVWEAYQKMSGCEQAAYRVRLCWAAMLTAALQEVK